MVIQPNMPVNSIVEIFPETKDVLLRNKVTITNLSLEKIVDEETLSLILNELNEVVGSSSTTCVEGG